MLYIADWRVEMIGSVDYELKICCDVPLTEDVYDEVIKRLQEEMAAECISGCFGYGDGCFDTICTYDDFEIGYNEDEVLTMFVDGEESEIREVARIEYPKHTKMSEDELLTTGFDYDISGELDDCSAYCYWVRV